MILIKSYARWLSNTTTDFAKICKNNIANSKYWHYLSPELELEKNDVCNDKINLINQFYIDSNSKRQEEIKNCLKFNVSNKQIDNIFLLNEREYSTEELGIDSNKIKQIIINKRLQYCDVFDIMGQYEIEGYIIIANSDIFFDKSIMDVRKTYLSTKKQILTLLRYEYDGKSSLKECHLFGPRSDSQDTWIFHSNNNINKDKRKIFNIKLGLPSCDNKLIYLWNILGYQCYNCPELIKTYHYHIIQKA